MPFDIEYHPDRHFVRVAAAGEIDMAAIRDYYERLEPVLAETNADRVLVDGRDADIQLSAADVFSIPRLAVKARSIGARKRALVTKPGVNGPELFEMGSRNHEQQVRVFIDHDQAIDWLLSENH